MATQFHGLRTVGYKVGNITAAKEWYTKILGVPPYFDEPFYVGFNVGGYELGLQPAEATGGPATANVVTYWGVDSVDQTYSELLANGATPLEKPTDVGDNIVVAAVRDPWGNAFGIIYNPHFVVK